MMKPITTQPRFLAIDLLRATTMFFMIFVNDIWTLTNIPTWIGHTNADVDGMGFADIIFPIFLFIVGLSIPYAIEAKIAKGEKLTSILLHIIGRTISLLIMGVLLVNAEYYSDQAYLHKSYWMILLIISFFLIWRVYPKSQSDTKYYRLVGIMILVCLTLVFKHQDGEQGIAALQAYWWGILGLIGWGYLTVALSYLFLRKQPVLLAIFAVLLLTLNICQHLHLLDQIKFISNYIWLVENGAIASFCIFGSLTTIIYKKWRKNTFLYLTTLTGTALALLLSGILTRPLWGISKIHATPSWIMICIGIAIFLFLIAVYLDEKKWGMRWYEMIKPAATSTLTCYMIPYLFYALLAPVYMNLPLVLTSGLLGLVKSLLFSFLIIKITGLLEQKSWKLKI